jgi:hypothetical protein
MPEARAQYELALQCYERKGDISSAASVRRALEALPSLPEPAR